MALGLQDTLFLCTLNWDVMEILEDAFKVRVVVLSSLYYHPVITAQGQNNGLSRDDDNVS